MKVSMQILYQNLQNFSPAFSGQREKLTTEDKKNAEECAKKALSYGPSIALETVAIINRAIFDTEANKNRRNRLTKMADEAEDFIKFDEPLNKIIGRYNAKVIKAIANWQDGIRTYTDEDGTEYVTSLEKAQHGDLPHNIAIIRGSQRAFAYPKGNGEINYVFSDFDIDSRHSNAKITATIRTGEIKQAELAKHWRDFPIVYKFVNNAPHIAKYISGENYTIFRFDTEGRIQTAMLNYKKDDAGNETYETYRRDEDGNFQTVGSL